MAIRFLLPLFLWMHAGCASPTPDATDEAENTALFVDDLGREVRLPSPVERIIPLAPNITEMVYAAGAGSLVAAVSQSDDFPPEVESLPRFSSFPLDYEALVSYSPDVIIATDQVNNPRDAHLMESLGMPVIYFSFDAWDDVLRAIRQIGNLAGVQTRADAVADSLAAAMDAASILHDPSSNAPSVLFLIGSDQLFAFGAGSYVHGIIALAGGKSLTADIDNPAPILSEEFVLTSQPDVIAGTFDGAEKLLERHPVFESLQAVMNERICTIEPSLLLRPGPRLADGAARLAECLRPAMKSP